MIDSRAARFAQGTTGIVALVGVVLGWPLAWALMALQLLVGLTLGRRFCLPCVAYFVLVQPRFGEGPLEDSRPPRLANAIGTVFLSSAAAAWWLGAPGAGRAIAGLVAFLALLSATSGFCVGCELYRLGARMRGISPQHRRRVDLADLPRFTGVGARYVEFTHPLCAECRDWERRLEGEELVVIDVRRQPDLARKYGVAIVPTVVRIDSDGLVIERLAP